MKLRSLQSLLTQTESLSLDCEITIMTCKLLESLFKKKKTTKSQTHKIENEKRCIYKIRGYVWNIILVIPSFSSVLFNRVKADVLHQANHLY